MLWARMVAYVTGTVNQELHREDKKGRRPRLVPWPRTPFPPKRAKRRRWAPLPPRPRRPIHEVQGWGIFDRHHGEFSTGVDKTNIRLRYRSCGTSVQESGEARPS